MLEEMANFFDHRLSGYEEHQLSIEGAREFYPQTAVHLPKEADAMVLDLGCGTGLELDEYFAISPTARVTGIDLAPGMLAALRAKHSDRNLTLIQGSYFDVPLPANTFDAAVSVQSLHHFPQSAKIGLYRKLYASLKPGGCFILTDYFAPTEAEEVRFREELAALKAAQGIEDGAFFHYDTPLTAEHEIESLTAAGFDGVSILARWGNTWMLRSVK